MNLRQGTLLKHGEYRIERELGHGGFGVKENDHWNLVGGRYGGRSVRPVTD